MTDPTLDQLIAGARRHAMSSEERREQGISFTLGNLVVETPNLFRGTVTMAVPREAFDRATLVASMVVGHIEPRITFDPTGAVRQFRLVQQLAERHAGGDHLAITPVLIRELHAAAGDPADPAFGSFRTLEIEVRGSDHVAPPSSEVDALVDELCAVLNARWEAEEALPLSAFALWRLAWIHPFVDGNGRVSRALCYLILCLKFGLLLPGAPTLVEQLADRRDEYFDALAAADLSYLATGTADLAPLTALLDALLVRQLRNLPALSGQDEAAISTIFRRRILAADSSVRARLYGAEMVQYRSWASGDTLIVHVGSDKAIAQAEALFELHGRPFPGLLAAPGQKAQLTIGPERNGAIIRLRDFVIGAAALHLESDTALTLEAPEIIFAEPADAEHGWEISGALYILRPGARLSEIWMADSLDLLVSRHLQAE
jgi:hypothetical protein